MIVLGHAFPPIVHKILLAQHHTGGIELLGWSVLFIGSVMGLGL